MSRVTSPTWWILSAILFVFCAAAMAPLPGHTVADNHTSVHEFIEDQEQLIPELIKRYGIPGAALAMVHDGEIVWVEGYGVADTETGRPVSSSTVFEAGSIAKSLTAWGVMRLVENGDVELDAPVEQYLTRWAFPESEYPTEEITIRRLLSNSSGLPFVIHIPSIDGLLDGEFSDDQVTPEQRAGEGFIYSNPGWVILALMIEDVSGSTYPAFMREEVLEPLGMHDSGFGWSDEFAERIAVGHTFDGDPVAVDDHGPYGAGSLYTSADDLARFLTASMPGANGAPAGGDVLTPESVELLHTPQIEVSGVYHRLMSESYGLGHFVETLPNGHAGITHGGESSGWLTAYYAVPETGNGLIFLTNSRRSWRMVSILDEWAEWQDLSSTVMTRNYSRMETGVQLAIALFALGSIANLGILLISSYRGTRRLAPLASPQRILRSILGLLAVLLIGGWWISAYNLAGPFFPILSVYLGIAITTFGLTLIALAATPTIDREPTAG